jgi:hypothetical protein
MAEFPVVPVEVQNQLAGERQPQSIPPLDVWMLDRIHQAEQNLQEGERIDPWFVSDSFLTYKDKIISAEMDVRGAQHASEAIQTETPEEQAFWNSANRVHEAYDIVAYSHYNEHQQRLLSGEVHGSTFPYIKAVKSSEPFTLNGREKGTLQTITTALHIPDDPQQQTYSFTSIPPAPKIVEGSVG